MKKALFLIIVAFSISISGLSQKPALDHSVYDMWKSVSSTAISDDGKWVSYQVNPQQGDGMLYYYNAERKSLDSVTRGSDQQFLPSSEYLIFKVPPSYNELREAKKKKLKDDKMPKGNTGIVNLLSGEQKIYERVKSFKAADEKSDWVAILFEKALPEKKDTTAAAKDTQAKNTNGTENNKKKPEPKGTDLLILNPSSSAEYRYSDVTEYAISANGNCIAFLQNIPDTSKTESFRVNIFDTGKKEAKLAFEGKGSVKKLTTGKTGEIVTFLFSSDTAKIKVYELWMSEKYNPAVKVAGLNSPGMPAGWSPSENGNVTYSDDGTRVFFGSAPKPVKEPEDTLLDDEKYKVDIWSWDDDILQPMQKKQLDREQKRTLQAIYHVDKKKIFQLADSIVPDLRLINKGNGSIALGSSDLKYRKQTSWDTRNYTDYYIVDVESGTRRQILENDPSQVILSPAGNYLLIYDYDTKEFYSMNPAGGEKKLISGGIGFPLYDELNDLPSDPRPYGLAGWLDDKRHVVVYDMYDLWMLDLEGSEKPVNITSGFGRTNNLRLRYVSPDREAEFIGSKESMILSAFNYTNKEAGFYSAKNLKPSEPVKLIMDKASFTRGITKSKKSEKIIYQRETFAESSDLWVADINFKNAVRISDANPQQKKYNWHTAELVEWYSFNNEKLQGILYKPENFDPSKKYPMIVYFYERSSDGLYTYFAPAPSASIINRTFAASNGYLVFVPDIPYRIGYPGQSCYNSVVSGTNSLIDRYEFIDRNRIGLDGQSWGGYQIAWLVTQTDMYKCAYAGAPVVNMTSAYGGIRWESGMSRMFQYEQTQSRIGGTLWDKPVHYIENSALFFAPKINTPLLLMHNDADGAVPWYQGIEFIVALRRLNKPAWMLSYNDEAHNLVKRPNRKDISIRKMQFFDHYLKDAPMPYWMKYGIDQIQKGKVDGYELVNE